MMSNLELPMMTNQLILEGPDLVGKTTLYNEIHRQTGFKWNIQDRSSLSMLCYARQFNRPPVVARARLNQELNNLNNRMVILLPLFEVIEKRYHERGDELQNLSSLRNLYNIFVEESNLIRVRPNVMCLTTEELVDIHMLAVEEWSHSLESCNLCNLGDVVRDTLHGIVEDETTLEARILYRLGEPNETILDNEIEGNYYRSILNDVIETIQNEKAGKNPYHVPQQRNSRRFYYHSNTCISSIHFMPRQNRLKTLVTFRSLDVDKNASIDLKFIDFLTHKVNKEFDFKCDTADVRITFNSAHIRRDLE